jgi:hypothetical protein
VPIPVIGEVLPIRVLRHASHTSTAHLRERNQTARPFKWTFRGYPLQTGAS